MFFLKKIIIHGFKSFALRTELELKEGVMGIVGPNGCGKSNIVDALKWVLGEKNIRSIRGDNVKDIIFAGTEEQKPLGMAEVEIILNNTDMVLPVKYNEVSVKRRIFGSGEPEHFINKQSVRLKDIYDLFSDTGVGKGSYSFMEQGKIDLILSDKPEDRRTIFEEAAGISRYKTRKKESMAKLESTSHNLEQINVLLRELEHERGSLKAQWEKAKVNSGLKEQLKQLEIRLYGSRHRALSGRLDEVNRRINELADRKTRMKTENSSLNAEIEKINALIFEYTQTKNKFEKDRSVYQVQIQSGDEKITIFSENLEKNRKDITGRKGEIEKLAAENRQHGDKIKGLDADLARYETQRQECESMLARIVSEIELLNENKLSNIRAKENYRTDIEAKKVTIEESKTELRKVTDEFVSEIDKKKREVEGRQDGQAGLKNTIAELLDRMEQDLSAPGAASDPSFPARMAEDIKNLKKLLSELTIHQDEFKNLIFDENGSYAKKENIDRNISRLMEQLIADQNRISLLETDNEQITAQTTGLAGKQRELEGVRLDLKHHISNAKREIENLQAQLHRNDTYIQNLSTEIVHLEESIRKLSADIENSRREIETNVKNCEEIDKQILKFEQDMAQENEKMSRRKDKIKDLMEKLETLDASIDRQKENRNEVESQIKECEHYLYNEFAVKMEEALGTLPETVDEKALGEQIDQVKMEIRNLGPVNSLAEEEYEDATRRFQFHSEQKEDLLKAKNDLLQIIEEVNRESEKMFMETFNLIRENFHQIFRRCFGGGRADLVLLEPDNVLESGIEIHAQPPGKKVHSKLLSGGERTLLAIGLLFSIFLVKPSPLCVLDEIDAALDDQNNLKFLDLMREFSRNTQFLIVSHNKQTIANTNYLYGVTMEEKGISKVISLELKKEKIDEFIK